jgi:hypothetical protein
VNSKMKPTKKATETMTKIIENTEKQLTRMRQHQADGDVLGFLWAQYALWDEYYTLRDAAKKNKKGVQQ